MTEAHVERRLAAILAADIAGYSALMGADEVRTVHDLKEHQAIVLPMVGKFGGRIIDTAGDGILAEFPSVVNAVKCAIAIQSEMTERNSAIDPKHRMQFRIGINIGDIIYDDARIYGDGINVAARLEGIAEPGGISISEDAWRQVQGKVAVSFHDTGEHHLKNIARPVRIYRVELAAKAAAAPHALPRALALPDKPSIAVLAFNNMSGDPEQEYFSDGITEDIITDLSKIGDLLVIARNSSFVYKGKPIDVKQVSRELGVRYVLEGSVRKAGSRVRVTGQLIDAANGAHIWADRFDRDLTDIFAVQDDVTKSIVDALRVKLTPTEMRRISEVPTHSTEAHDLFLRGREALLGSQSTKETFELAVRCFNRAIELDPNYAEPYVGLAHAYNRDFQNKWSGRADSKELSAHFSDLALEKGSELPYAHYMAGLVRILGRRSGGVGHGVRACFVPQSELCAGHRNAGVGQGLWRPPARSHSGSQARLSPRSLIVLAGLGHRRARLAQEPVAVKPLENVHHPADMPRLLRRAGLVPLVIHHDARLGG